MKWNWRPLSLKSWHFETSENIMTKFKSKGLNIIRIKYWNASESGSPPSFIPALCNIGILLHKQATQTKHFCPKCSCKKILHGCFLLLLFSPGTSCMQIMVVGFYFSLACIQYTSIHLKSFKISFAKSIGYMWESKASLLVHTHCAQCCVTFLNYLAKELVR